MNHTINNCSRFVLAVPAVCLCIWLNCCTSAEKKEPPKAAAEAPATEVFLLQKGKLSSAIQLPGELIAFQQVDLYAKVNSFVKKLYVDVGSEVHAGQLLAVLEAPELNSQLSGAASRLKAQEALYTASKANYDRLLETSKTPGTISPNDLDQAAARKNADLAQLESAKSAYKEIAETQNYLEIHAPFNGVITARNVNTGAITGPSGKGSELPIFTLQEQKKLRLVLAVPETAIPYLNNKTTVFFTVKGLPNEKFSATITRVAGALDSKFRSERVELDVSNSNKKLLPGMIAEVTLPTVAGDSSFVVPKTAVVNATEKVFVIKISNGKAAWVNVKSGREADGKTELYANLVVGDTLVKAGTEEIRNESVINKISFAAKQK